MKRKRLKSKIVEFKVDNPVSVNLLQKRAGNRSFNSKEYVAFKQSILDISKSFNFEMPLKGMLYCNVVFHPKDLKKRDLDNFSFKGLFDALKQSGVIEDDCQFYSLNAVKTMPMGDKKNSLEVELGYYNNEE